MAEPESSPLLAPKGKARASSEDEDLNSEAAPLLSSASGTPRYDGDQDDPDTNGDAAAASVTSDDEQAPRKNKSKKGWRWPSIIAMLTLGILAVAIMLLAFFLPAAVEDYAKEAAVLEPTNLSLESITADGVKARIQANFRLDGSRVNDSNSRRLGKFTTWVVRKLGTGETRVNVYLPEYNNSLLGSAVVPPLVVSLVDGDNTVVDIVADLSPGDVEVYRTIANNWLEGKLDSLKVLGKADVQIKSGILPLGTHPIAETLVFEANEIPTIPSYNITNVKFHDVPTPGEKQGAVGADITVTAYNDFPISLDVPELGFQILVPNCDPREDRISVAHVITRHVTVRAHSDVVVDAQGLIRGIPESLTRACPHSNSSPFDNLLHKYLHGDPPTVFVQGEKLSESKTPGWISDILSEITVPVPFVGHGYDSMIRNFSLTDVDFKMPGLLPDPDDPNDDGNPRVSGTIKVLAALPKEMTIGLDVTGIAATSDVLYKKQKMGELNLDRWNPANSTRLEDEDTHEPLVQIWSHVENVPLKITDDDVFAEVMRKMFFGSDKIELEVKAKVDARTETALGDLVIKDVPAEGRVPVKQMPHDTFGALNPQVGDLKIMSSTKDSLEIGARVNMTNPTPYAAYIPYMNVHIGKNGSILGSATVEGLNLTRGENSNILARATWAPSGNEGRKVASELLSQYISGYNVTIDVRAHDESIPRAPSIGRALSKLNISVPAPNLDLPGDGDDEGRFIRDAVFHIFSSTATFTLVSPLHYNTIYVDAVDATAYYNHTHPVGRIEYDIPFAAPPGASRTPKLPVEWSIGSIGYEAVRKALGGTLKLDAEANVTMRIGNWHETVWYTGRGIGAHIGL